MSRETGFYWVKRNDDWTIAHYNTGTWSISRLAQSLEYIRDTNLQEIDESRIDRNKETLEIKYRQLQEENQHLQDKVQKLKSKIAELLDDTPYDD